MLRFIYPEKMKLLDRNKSKITKDKNDENFAYLKITEIALIHVNVVNNSYQQNSRVYIFISNKVFGQLLNILLENFIFFNTFDLEFSYINVWLMDQNSDPIELEDKINITLVIN